MPSGNEEDFTLSVLQAMHGESTKTMVQKAVMKMLVELASQLDREPTEKEFFDYFYQLTEFYYKEVEPLAGTSQIKDLPTPPPYQTL